MAGTKQGGKLAAEKNKKKYGDSFYARIGAKGGRNGHTGGFASSLVDTRGMNGHERAMHFGRIGGKISSRAK